MSAVAQTLTFGDRISLAGITGRQGWSGTIDLGGDKERFAFWNLRLIFAFDMSQRHVMA